MNIRYLNPVNVRGIVCHNGRMEPHSRPTMAHTLIKRWVFKHQEINLIIIKNPNKIPKQNGAKIAIETEEIPIKILE